MATTIVPDSVSVSGGHHIKTGRILSVNSGAFVKPQLLALQSKSPSPTKRNLSIHAQYNDRSSGSNADFLTGFLLGGAVFGTLAYTFAPQIRRVLLNEDEHGFRRAKQPISFEGYDDGLEQTRHSLTEKIIQLNFAIDKVASRLRGGKKLPKVPVETNAEERAAF